MRPIYRSDDNFAFSILKTTAANSIDVQLLSLAYTNIHQAFEKQEAQVGLVSLT